jgi:hypothetical protein
MNTRVKLAVAAAILSGATVLSPWTAQAGSHVDVGIGFGIGAPVYSAPYYAPPPVYVTPPAYYGPPPVVISPPPPTYYAPPPTYYAPPPVVVSPPPPVVYYGARPVYGRPWWW